MKNSSVVSIICFACCLSQIGCGWVPGWSSNSEEATTEVAVSEPLAQDEFMDKIEEAANGIVSESVQYAEAVINAASVELNDVVQSDGFIGPVSNLTEFEQSLDPKFIKKAVVKTGELGLRDHAEIQMNLFNLECLTEEQWEMLQAIWVECVNDWNNFPVEYIRSRFIRHLNMAADALEIRKREKHAVLTPHQLSDVTMAKMYASKIFDGHIRPSVERYYKSILDKQITTARLQSQATVTE